MQQLWPRFLPKWLSLLFARVFGRGRDIPDPVGSMVRSCGQRWTLAGILS